MRLGGYVLDTGDLKTRRLQRANRGLTSGAGALDEHFDLLQTAASAVTWAANGVDLREPLKPAPPADSHAMTFPSRSVSETMVLLNEVLMWA